MPKLNQKLTLILVVGAVASLAGCATEPSPWSQQGSPWEARQADIVEQPIVEEVPVVVEESPASEPAANTVDLGEPGTPMEDPTAGEESPVAAYVDEPVAEVPVAAEPEYSDALAPVETGDIANVSAEQFAVQVVASSSMENLMAFASANNIPSDWVAKTIIDDKVWFILLSGIYANKAEADQALFDVSANLETSPWIRSVGSIQAVMTP